MMIEMAAKISIGDGLSILLVATLRWGQIAVKLREVAQQSFCNSPMFMFRIV